MSLTPIAREGRGKDRGQGQLGPWGRRDNVLSCQRPRKGA